MFEYRADARGGSDPQVTAAGKVWFDGGRVIKIDNASGHFQPPPGSLKEAQKAFEKLGPKAFDPKTVKFVDYNGKEFGG